MKQVTGYKIDSNEGLIQTTCFNNDDDVPSGSVRTV
jgi:hypothetical protein